MCHFKKKGKKQNKQNLHSFNLATRCFSYWLLPCYCWVGPVLVTTSPADMLFITILDYLFFLIKNGLELFEPFKSHPRCEVKLRQVGADPNHPCKVKTRPMRVLWQQPALALCPQLVCHAATADCPWAWGVDGLTGDLCSCRVDKSSHSW